MSGTFGSAMGNLIGGRVADLHPQLGYAYLGAAILTGEALLWTVAAVALPRLPRPGTSRTLRGLFGGYRQVLFRRGVPLLLAAIPTNIESSLSRRLETAAGVSVAVHGRAHRDHAPPGEKRAEFGAHRPLEALMADAAAGLQIARQRLPEASLLPVFVPPWNRVAPDLAAALPALGYRGLSAVPGPPIPGLLRLDATLDPIDWRGTRGLIDPDCLLRGLAADIAGAPERPLGLLTHHRIHDEAVWDFVGALVNKLLRHPAIQVLDLRGHFGAAAMDMGPAVSKSQVSQIARTG